MVGPLITVATLSLAVPEACQEAAEVEQEPEEGEEEGIHSLVQVGGRARTRRGEEGEGTRRSLMKTPGLTTTTLSG